MTEFTQFYTVLVFCSPESIVPSESEKNYLSKRSPKKPLPLGSIHDEKAEVDLTVVIPAYKSAPEHRRVSAGTIFLRKCQRSVQSALLQRSAQLRQLLPLQHTRRHDPSDIWRHGWPDGGLRECEHHT